MPSGKKGLPTLNVASTKQLIRSFEVKRVIPIMQDPNGNFEDLYNTFEGSLKCRKEYKFRRKRRRRLQ